MNTHWLYPHVHNPRRILPYVFLGAALGGIYGAIHDQLSYCISPEYFTEYKLEQFGYADFGLPNRVFAATVGFLGTWWVGMFAGWFLGRIRYRSEHLVTARADILHGFVVVFTSAVVMGTLGGIVGFAYTRLCHIRSFLGWEAFIEPDALPGFAIVSFLHYGGYLGGLTGLIAAIALMKRKMRRTPHRELTTTARS